jgi:uncharacterized protein (DUF433 family)
VIRELDRITVNPQICLGQPMIRGMRITVGFVLKLLASQLSIQEILEAYPELEEEDIARLLIMQLGLYPIISLASLQQP